MALKSLKSGKKLSKHSKNLRQQLFEEMEDEYNSEPEADTGNKK